jgi:ankyrin repeat protein
VQPKAAPALKYNDLMTAVLYKDAEAVAELLRHGTWVDKPDSRGATPLMLAVELGDARTAETLLRGGANPSRAVRVAQSRRDAAMLDLLTRYGAR